MLTNFTKQDIATAIAVFFHAIGLAGLLYFDKSFFINATPFNLLLSFILLLWTQPEKNSSFWLFLVACYAVGFMVELVGVNTSLLFGHYAYGEVLGWKVKNVPLLIGVNWFIIIYCSGISIHMLLTRLVNRMQGDAAKPAASVKALSVIVDGATMAVFFDWLMEPVAVKLGYWAWEGPIPFFNYGCWFGISLLLLALFHVTKFNKQNKFAVNLLLIQLMFFLILRTFME
ncbi:MAG TPA: carotenoid biosynthesis protein [Ferruginibacter sp.]|nr:carotenoid biosynthesis protein [Chitinophagaceae bacterium]HRI24265.1 carotenoid biosynthesis protein [Ferruginibacter sp.]